MTRWCCDRRPAATVAFAGAVAADNLHLCVNGQALCSLLGTKPKDMRGRDMASLLPQPFGLLHHRWIKDADGSLTKPPPSSCRAGAVHSLLSANGVHVPVRMAISSRDFAGVNM